MSDEDLPIDRESAEYKAALEVELWKEITEQEFRAKAHRQEENLLAKLSDSFKKEHLKVSNEISSAKKAYEELLRQYKTKLVGLEKREKKYVQNNSAFERAHETFSRERTAKIDDVKQKSSRRSEFLSIELDTVIQKAAAAERLNSRLSHRIEELEKTISFKDLEQSRILQVENNDTSLNLQNELFDVKTAYTGAKERLSKMTASKEKYKMKLKSVLEELSKARHQPVTSYRSQLSVPSVPQHQKCAILDKKPELSDFSNIRSELDNIISMMSQIPEQPVPVPGYQVDSEIAKLISERNTLLNTGVYMADDFIIKKIDDKIKQLLPLEKISEHGLS